MSSDRGILEMGRVSNFLLSFCIISNLGLFSLPAERFGSENLFAADSSGVRNPVIQVWYGHAQQFGNRGNPTRWINILGNVSGQDSVVSLTYSFNGGPETALSVGPDTRRLSAAGDFNIDLPVADLLDGANEVIIEAIDELGNRAVDTVSVDYAAGNSWPENYSIDWSASTDIQRVAQVTDGLWHVENSSVRTTLDGYDRLIGSQVSITIYNLLGQRVRTLVNEAQPAGAYDIMWDGTNDQGVKLSSGVYVYWMKTEKYSQIRKMLYIK